MGAAQSSPQLLFESCRERIAAAGQRSDHHAFVWVEFVEQAAGDMPESA